MVVSRARRLRGSLGTYDAFSSRRQGIRSLRESLRDYREHYRRTHPFLEIRLRWNLPGAVWAMDHTLEKGRGKVFSVKDLATGRQLLYQKV